MKVCSRHRASKVRFSCQVTMEVRTGVARRSIRQRERCTSSRKNCRHSSESHCQEPEEAVAVARVAVVVVEVAAVQRVAELQLRPQTYRRHPEPNKVVEDRQPLEAAVAAVEDAGLRLRQRGDRKDSWNTRRPSNS